MPHWCRIFQDEVNECDVEVHQVGGHYACSSQHNQEISPAIGLGDDQLHMMFPGKRGSNGDSEEAHGW